MNLSDLGNWVESEQYQKILNYLNQAPTIMQKLRDAGILKNNTAEELQTATDNGQLSFQPNESASVENAFDMVISVGGKVLEHVSWAELAKVVASPMSLATFGLAMHNALMLHHINNQLHQIDVKLNEVLEGQEIDRDAKCKSALDLLEQAKMYNAAERMQINILTHALENAVVGYNAILPGFVKNAEHLFESMGVIYAIEKQESDGICASIGQALLKSKMGRKVGRFLNGVAGDEEGNETIDRLEQYHTYLNTFQRQWRALYVATYVQAMVHLLMGNRQGVNACIQRFGGEVMYPILLDDIDEEDQKVFNSFEDFVSVYNEAIEQADPLGSLLSE